MMSVIERFLEKIVIFENGCWNWEACKNQYGYGLIKIKKVSTLSHRFIYEYYYGQLCPDLEIDHLCRNRACCNPLHLDQVTHKVNLLRGDTINAINARKTHCPQGHKYTSENTYIDYKNARRCKICRKEQSKTSLHNMNIIEQV